MLSEREAQALRRIEQQLSADDPELAVLMTRTLPLRPSRTRRLVHNLVIGVALVLALLCMALGDVGAGLLAASFAGVVLALRRSWGRRWISRRRTRETGPA